MSSNGHTIATTILEQLGGSMFLVMTGAKHLLHGEHELQFHLPKKYNHINAVRIELLPNDSYKVDFYNIRKRGLNIDTIASHENVPAESLRGLFTSTTGLDCTLGTMGKV